MFKSHNKSVKGMNKPLFYDWKGKTKTDFITLFFKFFLKSPKFCHQKRAIESCQIPFLQLENRKYF